MSSRTKNIGCFGGYDCNSLFPSGQNVITLNITHSYQYSVKPSGNDFSPERHGILYSQTHKSEAASKYLKIIGKTRKLSHSANSGSHLIRPDSVILCVCVCASVGVVWHFNHWKISTHVSHVGFTLSHWHLQLMFYFHMFFPLLVHEWCFWKVLWLVRSAYVCGCRISRAVNFLNRWAFTFQKIGSNLTLLLPRVPLCDSFECVSWWHNLFVDFLTSSSRTMKDRFL